MAKFKVGDVIGYKRWPDEPHSVKRRIVSVRETGYTWEYPEFPGKYFHTENSSDPLLQWHWSLVSADIRGEDTK